MPATERVFLIDSMSPYFPGVLRTDAEPRRTAGHFPGLRDASGIHFREHAAQAGP